MKEYLLRRILYMLLTLFFVSIIVFVVIQLPPGDFLTSYIAQLATSGESVNLETIEALKKQYGLDKPIWEQYLLWIWNVLHGDFGRSLLYNRPVSELIGERLAITFVISLFTLVFIWVVGFLIGTYSATHQYSFGDYFFTFLGYIGLSVPAFMVALILLWVAYAYFGQNLTGLFSPEYLEAKWSFAKFVDMLKHIWVPVVIIGLANTAGMIRTLRANLLDELNKPYVLTARAKGLKEWKVVFKYPLRVAMIPFISTVGWSLPFLVSGAEITAIVLNLPTSGPLLLEALRNQDMYLAGAFLLMLSFLTMLGTLISDLLLAWVDPRVRYE
ncbi:MULTISPECIES: ABC transporter permease [Dictyoglomus]|uniref:Binding-protein-dependent transport systems inner membrane component n=1 Tax=Dictyoglomus turgidum (strain DSM 6724 / Z-1310) TaxID=515635 RepID=B8E3A5_DICTD|nr:MULTISPECIES: ABC transporter permease [Dictyoglomus]ACK42979.1 binding-protein-dependent transport systems inner membrane component [Dictyoglomus turgidum DSM 6724]HBU31043.1 ABC transporter permease [Dictyoglomus sp.]